MTARVSLRKVLLLNSDVFGIYVDIEFMLILSTN